MATLPKTPSGETLEKVRSLMRKVDGNPRMRRAIAAAIKAMGLPAPMVVSEPPTKEAAKGAGKERKPNG